MAIARERKILQMKDDPGTENKMRKQLLPSQTIVQSSHAIRSATVVAANASCRAVSLRAPGTIEGAEFLLQDHQMIE